jgi:hypothetical protein
MVTWGCVRQDTLSMHRLDETSLDQAIDPDHHRDSIKLPKDNRSGHQRELKGGDVPLDLQLTEKRKHGESLRQCVVARRLMTILVNARAPTIDCVSVSFEVGVFQLKHL